MFTSGGETWLNPILLSVLFVGFSGVASPAPCQIFGGVTEATAYRAYFGYVGNGVTTRGLNSALVDLLRPHFDDDVLERVRIGTSSRVSDGNAMADCETIYWPSGSGMEEIITDLRILEDSHRHRMHWFFHELWHAEQCDDIGGRTAYSLRWFGELGATTLYQIARNPGSISDKTIHDAMPMERDAEQAADRVDGAFRRPAVRYNASPMDTDGDGKMDLVFLGQDDGLNVLTIRSNYPETNWSVGRIWDGRIIKPTPNPDLMDWSVSQKAKFTDGRGIHHYPRMIADVNGDGRDDLVFVGQNWSGSGLNVRTKFSNGDGTWTSSMQVLSDGSAVHDYPSRVADVNGDGKDDLVFVGQNWSGSTGLAIRTKLSNGDGRWIEKSHNHGDGSGVHRYPMLVADVNGDDRDDLVFVGQGWSGPGLNIRTKLSMGDGTYAKRSQVLGDGSGVHRYPTLVADVNGDGRDDLVFVGQGWSGPGLNIRTKLSRGDGTWTSRSQVLRDGSMVHRFRTMVGDVNGDGKDDLVFVGQDWSGSGLNIRTKLSNGDGTWTSKSQVLGDGSMVHRFHPYGTRIGDVNGDGRADIVFVGTDWNTEGLHIRTKLSLWDGTWASASKAFPYSDSRIDEWIMR